MSQVNLFRTQKGLEKDFSDFLDARYSTIGIILASENDEMVVKFATQGITNKIFVSRYQLYLPDKEQLRRELVIALEEETRRLARAKRENGRK